MVKQYDTFVGSLDDIPDYGEVELSVRSLEPGWYKYTSSFVRAIVARQEDRLPDGDLLAIRFLRGGRHGKTVRMRILEKLGEYKKSGTRVRT